MHLLKARFRDNHSFLKAYNAELPSGGMFVATTIPLERDDEVLIEVHFPDLPNKTLLRATVLSWRTALPRLGVRAGAMVAFHKDDAEKRDFLLAVATGKIKGAIKRRHARLPIELPVRWRLINSTEQRKARLRDISIGGAQLLTDDKLDVGEDVVVELTAPGGAQAVAIASQISNVKPNGYGISFIYRDGGGSRRLREMVRRLARG